MEAKPTYEDVMRCVEALCRDNPLAKAASAGKSVEGRDIPIVEIKGVYYDGKELSPGQEDGFVSWQDTASTIVRVNVDAPLTKGEHAASVKYDLQW